MRLDLLAGAVRGADRVTESRDRHAGLALTVEAAPEDGDPLEKQSVAVPRMADRTRQILHDILDQAAGSRIRSRDIAQRDATPQQRPPRAGLRRQRLVETCRERGSQQIVKHDGRIRYTAVLADQRAEACRLPHQPGEGADAFGAGSNGDALRDEPDAVEAQARARKGNGVDCLTETVFVPRSE